MNQPDQWRALVESLVHVSGSNSGRLILEKSDRSEVLASIDVGFEPGVVETYAKYYVSRDMWINAVEPRPTDSFYSSIDVVRQKDYLNSEMYCDWAKPQGIHHATAVYLANDDDSGLRFCMQRSEREGSYTTESIKPLSQLIPHLKRASQLHYEFSELHRVNQSTSNILDQMPFAAFLLDEHSRIQFRNANAEKLLSDCEQFITSNNKLVIGDGAQGTFPQKVHDCIVAGQGGGKNPAEAFHVSGSEDQALMEVLVSPLVVDSYEFCFQFRKVMALVLIKDLSHSAGFDTSIIRELYGLTKREALICSLICSGKTIAQITNISNISIHTVRSHVKRLLQKTSTKSQSQLVGKILSGVSALSNNTDNDQP